MASKKTPMLASNDAISAILSVGDVVAEYITTTDKSKHYLAQVVFDAHKSECREHQHPGSLESLEFNSFAYELVNRKINFRLGNNGDKNGIQVKLIDGSVIDPCDEIAIKLSAEKKEQELMNSWKVVVMDPSVETRWILVAHENVLNRFSGKTIRQIKKDKVLHEMTTMHSGETKLIVQSQVLEQGIKEIVKRSLTEKYANVFAALIVYKHDDLDKTMDQLGWE